MGDTVTVRIGLPVHKVHNEHDEGAKARRIVTPGEIITTDAGFMKGHGTHTAGEGLCASTAGAVEKVSKLLVVQSLSKRYTGEVGDVVVGRVTEVAQRRWKIDVNSRLDASLMLSAVSLPGNVLRRRQAEDEFLMREMFVEADVVAAEVQSINSDGSANLHRVKFGQKLQLGVVVNVHPLLVKRTKTQSHTLPCGVLLILGMNGTVWVGPPHEESPDEPHHDNLKELADSVPLDLRTNVARVCTCVMSLNAHHVAIYDATVMLAYESCLAFPVRDLLRPDVAEEIVQEARLLN